MATFDEQLATAMVAKLAGMTLNEVDQNTVQQSSSGPALKIDPMSFVTSVQERKVNLQQAQAAEDNRRAEQMYPLPPPLHEPLPPPIPGAVVSPLPVQAQVYAPVQQVVHPDSYVLTKEDVQSIRSQLEKVNSTLTKMAGMLGKVFAGLTEKK